MDLAEVRRRIAAAAPHPQRVDPVERVDHLTPDVAYPRTRTPVYEPTVTVAYDQDAQVVHFPTPDTHGTDKVSGPDTIDRGYRIAVPQRKLIVMGRYKRSANGVTDGSGNAVIEFTNVVPTNQTWIIDRVAARVAGAGSGLCILYEGAAGNDDGMLCVIPLTGANAAQIDGNPIEVGPGQKIVAQFFNAGAAFVATVRIFYRMAEYESGRAEDTTP